MYIVEMIQLIFKGSTLIYLKSVQINKGKYYY